MIIKTAFVDSGISHNFTSQVVSRAGFDIDSAGNIFENSNIEDESGHGSMCLSAYFRNAPKSDISIVRILDRNRLSHSKVLLQALLYLCDSDVNIINLSLSASSIEYKKELEKVCDKLTNQGKLIIAAYSNDDSDSYPACFDCVVGVRGMFFDSDQTYWFDDRTKTAVANMTPKMLKSINDSYSMMGGTSVATALFSSATAQVWAENANKTNEEIVKVLYDNAKKHKWCVSDLRTDGMRSFKQAYDERLNGPEIEKLIDIVKNRGLTRDIPTEQLLTKPLYMYYTCLDSLNQIIHQLEKEFGIAFNMEKIDYWTFYSMYDLSRALGEAIYENRK